MVKYTVVRQLCQDILSLWLQETKDHGKQDLPAGTPVFTAPKGLQSFWTSVRLSLAPPWRRFKKGSVLVIEASHAY